MLMCKNNDQLNVDIKSDSTDAGSIKVTMTNVSSKQISLGNMGISCDAYFTLEYPNGYILNINLNDNNDQKNSELVKIGKSKTYTFDLDFLIMNNPPSKESTTPQDGTYQFKLYSKTLDINAYYKHIFSFKRAKAKGYSLPN